MKKFCKVLVSSVVIAAMTGCSSTTEEVEKVMDAQEVYGCNVINVFNSGEYIGEDVVANFEKAYGASVNYSMFDSNEALYTKLQGGSYYDVLVPSDYMIERLLEEDYLQPLDKNIITNWDTLSDAVKNLSFDPDNEYSVPYFYGTVGIVYNKNNVDEEQLHELGYDIFRQEEYKGRVFMYDSERDSFMIALKALGYSMNTEDPDELQEAYEWLLEVDEKVDPAYVMDEVIDAMSNGDRDLAILYSGDAAYVLNENEDMGYYLPESGTNIWYDSMVIPANSQCYGLANEFINYMMTYDVAYENSEYIGYTSPNKDVFDEISQNVYTNEAYIPREGFEKDEIFHYSKKQKDIISDLWIKVKNH